MDVQGSISNLMTRNHDGLLYDLIPRQTSYMSLLWFMEMVKQQAAESPSAAWRINFVNGQLENGVKCSETGVRGKDTSAGISGSRSGSRTSRISR